MTLADKINKEMEENRKAVFNKLILVRGASGSGKSTFAKKLVKKGIADAHFEADMFFTDKETGEYKFNQSKLKEAHKWCQEKTFNSLRLGLNVVVSNTFTKLWEIHPYIDFCEKNKIAVEIYRCIDDYGDIHNVPNEVIERQKNGYEGSKLETIV